MVTASNTTPHQTPDSTRRMKHHGAKNFLLPAGPNLSNAILIMQGASTNWLRLNYWFPVVVNGDCVRKVSERFSPTRLSIVVNPKLQHMDKTSCLLPIEQRLFWRKGE
jgi:hypothetical protein